MIFGINFKEEICEVMMFGVRILSFTFVECGTSIPWPSSAGLQSGAHREGHVNEKSHHSDSIVVLAELIVWYCMTATGRSLGR